MRVAALLLRLQTEEIVVVLDLRGVGVGVGATSDAAADAGRFFKPRR